MASCFFRRCVVLQPTPKYPAARRKKPCCPGTTPQKRLLTRPHSFHHIWITDQTSGSISGGDSSWTDSIPPITAMSLRVSYVRLIKIGTRGSVQSSIVLTFVLKLSEISSSEAKRASINCFHSRGQQLCKFWVIIRFWKTAHLPVP